MAQKKIIIPEEFKSHPKILVEKLGSGSVWISYDDQEIPVGKSQLSALIAALQTMEGK